MQIKGLKLKNFKAFENAEVVFDTSKNIAVLIGNNGAGKTSVLEGIAYVLSHFVAKTIRATGRGSVIKDLEVFNGQPFSQIGLEFHVASEVVGSDCDVRLVKIGKGKQAQQRALTSNLEALSKLAEQFRTQLTEDENNACLPLIAYYPCERSVVDVPLKIKNKHSFNQLDGYENSLTQGANFRLFFEWFREREDFENEQRLDGLLADEYPDRQLTAVRSAVEVFTGFCNMRVHRKPQLGLFVEKQNPESKESKKLNVLQLSQGEKILFALVGDMARRLAIMNPSLVNPLEGNGIALIDEIELHLHPNWQRKVIIQLQKTFPNVQFILTTHSPIVISEPKDVQVFSLNEGIISELPNLYGLDVDQVLLQEMGAEVCNADVKNAIDEVLDLIQDGDLDKAREQLTGLKAEISSTDSKIMQADLWLKRAELKHAKNH